MVSKIAAYLEGDGGKREGKIGEQGRGKRSLLMMSKFGMDSP